MTANAYILVRGCRKSSQESKEGWTEGRKESRVSKSNDRAALVRFEIRSMISDQKSHSTQFNCHFIKSVLKSHNFIALNLDFWCIVPVAGLLKKGGTGSAFTSHLVCKTMSCDENSFEHDKETSNSEVRTKIVYFRDKSSVLVA